MDISNSIIDLSQFSKFAKKPEELNALNFILTSFINESLSQFEDAYYDLDDNEENEDSEQDSLLRSLINQNEEIDNEQEESTSNQVRKLLLNTLIHYKIIIEKE